MSEEQEAYNTNNILDQATQIAGQRDKELDKLESAKLGQQIKEAMEKARQLVREVVPPTPIHAVLMAKFGHHWRNAFISSYVFPGEISMHVAMCRVVVNGSNVILSELVYQIGEVCSILEKTTEGV